LRRQAGRQQDRLVGVDGRGLPTDRTGVAADQYRQPIFGLRPLTLDGGGRGIGRRQVLFSLP
jgi:hypothetical protein